MPDISQQTLAAIVSDNSKAAPVLESHHLDYCCKGKRTLADACKQKGIELIDVVQELLAVSEVNENKTAAFSEMPAHLLTNYIVSHHHAFVKQSMPVIYAHLQKVSFKHGEDHPYMKEVLKLFTEVRDEMTLHMEKEEQVLFPRINKLEKEYTTTQQTNVPENFIKGPVEVMENEHEHAGDALYKIREITKNYTPPAGACVTFTLCLKELEEFEIDLHQHVHLENNILFPKALSMINRGN